MPNTNSSNTERKLSKESVSPSRDIIEIDGSLSGSKEILEIWNKVVKEIGEIKFAKMIESVVFPMVLPLMDIYYSLVKEKEISKMIHRINSSIEQFGGLSLQIKENVGEKLLLCGFPSHFRTLLELEQVSIKVIEPLFSNDESKNAFREMVTNFSSKIEIRPTNVESIFEDIMWADAIMTETYGIVRGDYVYVPTYASFVVMTAYERKRTCLIASELQRCSYKELLEGFPISPWYFTDIITEKGLTSAWRSHRELARIVS